MIRGSFKVVSKTKHSKTKTEARSTQISKTKHPKLENEAPKSRKRSTQNSKTKTPRSKTICVSCCLASFGSTHLTPVVFTRFGFPQIGFLFNFILFWILGIRYRLCTEHLNTDGGEAARFQKLLTTIKDNTILPTSPSLIYRFSQGQKRSSH